MLTLRLLCSFPMEIVCLPVMLACCLRPKTFLQTVCQAEEAAEGSEPPRMAGPSRRASRILPPAQGSLVQSNGINAGHATMHQAARGLPPRHGLSAAQSGWAGAAAQAPIETDNQQQTHDWQQLQQRPQQHGSLQSVKGLEQPAPPAAELDGAALVQHPRVGDWEPGEPAGVMDYGVVSRVPSMEPHEEAPGPMRVRGCIEQYLPPQQALRQSMLERLQDLTRRCFNASLCWLGQESKILRRQQDPLDALLYAQ